MSQSSEPPSSNSQPTELFDEYLRLIDEGDRQQAKQVLAAAPESTQAIVRDRIAIHESLDSWGQEQGSKAGDLAVSKLTHSPSEFQGSADAPNSKAQQSHPRGGDSLGRFEGLIPLQKGGLSEVYRSQDDRLNRPVAIKVLTQSRLGNEESRRWLINEARALAHLQHPGIVRVYEADQHDSLAFVVMEFVQGPSLHEVLECMAGRNPDANAEVKASAEALRPLEARCRMVAALAEALDYCHTRGIIHRDIKPGNILLEGGTKPRLIDFGLASIQGEGHTTTQITQGFVGTPAYISPEQVNNRRTGASALSDQFSLGVVLYQTLSLTNPFESPYDRESTLDSIAKADPPPLSHAVVGWSTQQEPLGLICRHCLEKVPQDRYESVGALARDLERFLDGRPISVKAPTAGARLALWSRRNRKSLQLGFVAVLLIGLAVTAAIAMQARTRAGSLWDRLKKVGQVIEVNRTSESINRLDETYLAANQLGDIRREYADERRTLWGRLFLNDPDPLCNQNAEGYGQIVFDELSSREAEARVDLAPFDATVYSKFLELDRQLNPNTSINQAFRNKGAVHFPRDRTGLRLWKRPEPKSVIGLTPVIAMPTMDVRLNPGQLYRLTKTDPQGSVLFDIEFMVPDGTEPALSLEATPKCEGSELVSVVIDDEQLNQWLAKARTDSRNPDSPFDMPSNRALIPAYHFSISDRITWEDFEREMGKTDTTFFRAFVVDETSTLSRTPIGNCIAAGSIPTWEDLALTEPSLRSNPNYGEGALTWARVFELLPPDVAQIWKDCQAQVAPSAEAIVWAETATEYSRKVGRRLPSILEFVGATRVGALGSDPTPEWCSHIYNGMQEQGTPEEILIANFERPVTTYLALMPRAATGAKGGAAFRTCISDHIIEEKVPFLGDK